MPRLISRTLGALVLAAQAGLFAWWLLSPARAAHLTPYEGQVSYRLYVTRNGHPLGFGEIEQRYRLPAVGRTSQSPASLEAVIREVERRHAPDETIAVRLHHRVDELPEEIWLWPEN